MSVVAVNVSGDGLRGTLSAGLAALSGLQVRKRMHCCGLVTSSDQHIQPATGVVEQPLTPY
jgi:hypothetical protein